jgi:hypothetical protein
MSGIVLIWRLFTGLFGGSKRRGHGLKKHPPLVFFGLADGGQINPSERAIEITT